MDQGQTFRISDWRIDPGTCSISQDEIVVHLEPKVMDLLVYMAKSPGTVHSRDELLDNVWPGVVVSDEALTSAIIKLRKAFNDSARESKVIETVPKRGYRLIARVENSTCQLPPGFPEAGHLDDFSVPVPAPGSTDPSSTSVQRKIPTWLLLVVAAIGILVGINTYHNFKTEQDFGDSDSKSGSKLVLPEKPSIAVMPFLNIGNDIEDSFFSDGITDDLITDLSSLSGLFVISRNSTFRFKGRTVDTKEVARMLGVKYVLEGSVRRSGQRIRVNTRLIDGTSGGQLWAERYEGDPDDIFSLQDQMTARIINALALTLTEREEILLKQVDTQNPQAYEEFLRGIQLSTRIDRESFVLAEQHFKMALQLDPDYARAHAALAMLYIRAWETGWHLNAAWPGASWARARKHLEAAMVQPSAQTHGLRSTMHLHNRRFKTAIEEARTAVSLNPSSAYGYLALAEALAYTGQSEQAVIEASKARRLDPESPAPYLLVEGRARFDLKQYRQAIDALEKSIEINPRNYKPLIFLIASHGQLGEAGKAGDLLERLNHNLEVDNSSRFTVSSIRNGFPYENLPALQHLKDGLIRANVPEW